MEQETIRLTRTAGGGILETSTALRVPLDRAFAFFASAENLQAITPPELRFGS